MNNYVLCDGMDRVCYCHDHTATDKQNVHGIVNIRAWKMDYPASPVLTLLKVLNFRVRLVFTVSAPAHVVRASAAGLRTFVDARIHREYETEERLAGGCRLLAHNGVYVGAALVDDDGTLTVCLKRAADARVATKYVRSFFNYEMRPSARVSVKKPLRAGWQIVLSDTSANSEEVVDYCDVTDTDAVALFLQQTQLVYTSYLTFPDTAVLANAWDKVLCCNIVYVSFEKLRVLHKENPAELFMKIAPEVPIYKR